MALEHRASSLILHVARTEAWQAAQAAGVYAPPELARDGFLHACTHDQLGFVLARHFAGISGLMVIEIDPAQTGARVDWVASEPDQAPFPHHHGPVPVAAVLGARLL